MANNVSDLHPTKELLEREPGKLGRSLLLLGALGVATGVGYAARAFAGPEGAPPSPTEGQHAATLQKPADGDPGKPKAAAAPVASPDPAGLAEGEVEKVIDVGDEPVSEGGAAEATTDGAFYVQVASYKNEQDADAYTATLAARGLPARSAPSADESTGSWHLVRLGPFQSRGDAEKARFQLKLGERHKAYVIPRSNGKYHVQVGSFATLAEAEPAAKRLADRGHVTKISRIKMGDKRWHCVRIGPFDTAEEAADYKDLVTGIPGAEPTVIPFPPPQPRAAR